MTVAVCERAAFHMDDWEGGDPEQGRYFPILQGHGQLRDRTGSGRFPPIMRRLMVPSAAETKPPPVTQGTSTCRVNQSTRSTRPCTPYSPMCHVVSRASRPFAALRARARVCVSVCLCVCMPVTYRPGHLG